MDHVQSTRHQLIDLLFTNKHQFVSGQKLADALSISRNAIWKHMKELEKDGYTIEAQARKGYRIVGVPSKMSENTLKWGLNTDWLGKTIIHKESVASTQWIAHELARNGSAHGTIVIADEQTDGKGRMDRSFHSKSGKGLWMSLLIRPQILPYLAPQLTLLTATVLAETLDDLYGIQAQIKWPNDVLIEEQKAAGILTEMHAEQDQIQYVIIGLGLNVFHQKEDFQEDLVRKATSLQLHTKEEVDLQQLAQAILQTFEQQYALFIEGGFDDIKEKWEKYGYKIGELISITTMKESWTARFLGIAEDGALITQKDGEQPKRLYSAEIEWFSSPNY